MNDYNYVPTIGEDYTELLLSRTVSQSYLKLELETLWKRLDIDLWVECNFSGWDWVRYSHCVHKYDDVYHVLPVQNSST